MVTEPFHILPVVGGHEGLLNLECVDALDFEHAINVINSSRVQANDFLGVQLGGEGVLGLNRGKMGRINGKLPVDHGDGNVEHAIQSQTGAKLHNGVQLLIIVATVECTVDNITIIEGEGDTHMEEFSVGLHDRGVETRPGLVATAYGDECFLDLTTVNGGVSLRASVNEIAQSLRLLRVSGAHHPILVGIHVGGFRDEMRMAAVEPPDEGDQCEEQNGRNQDQSEIALVTSEEKSHSVVTFLKHHGVNESVVHGMLVTIL